jgi:N-acetylglucosamine kinase-like BadF-type ATPase
MLVGIDVGGTKVAARVTTTDGAIVAETTGSSADWSATPVAAAARWIAARAASVLPTNEAIVSLGVGAQGCDTNEHCRALERELEALRFAAVVVNDAALLIPAAGLASGIGIIAGTGSIAVGSAADGSLLFAGGWGWVLGDEGSAPGLVREATRTALRAHEEGQPDDGLLAALLAAFEVADAAALARSVNDDPRPDHWGSRAPSVFVAADAGSRLADAVIANGGLCLARLAAQLRRRGAVGNDVVAAGSVIARQPRLVNALRAGLAGVDPELTFHLLDVPPVAGAVELARRRAGSSSAATPHATIGASLGTKTHRDDRGEGSR